MNPALVRELRLHRLLLRTVENGSGLCYERLREELSCSQPTLNETLASLASAASEAGLVDVLVREGRPVLVRYARRWSHPLEGRRELWLTRAEEGELGVLTAGLDQGPLRRLLEGLLGRVGEPVPEECRSERVRGMAPEPAIPDLMLFRKVREAVEASTTLQFRYTPLQDWPRSGRAIRQVFPLRLWNARGLWLLLGVDRVRLREGASVAACLRNFALVGIADLELLTSLRPVDLDGLDPDAFLGDGFFNLFRDAPEDGMAEVLIHTPLAGLARVLPWHRQEHKEECSEGVRIRFPFATKPALLHETARLLLEWGECLEVLGPDPLCEAVRTLVRRMGENRLPG